METSSLLPQLKAHLSVVGDVFGVGRGDAVLYDGGTLGDVRIGGEFDGDESDTEGVATLQTWHPLAITRWSYEFAVPRADAVDLKLDADRELTPGVHGELLVESPATVTLAPGTYSFREIIVEKGATLRVRNDALTKVFVRGNVKVSGTVDATDTSISNVWWVQPPESKVGRDSLIRRGPVFVYVAPDSTFLVNAGSVFGNVIAGDLRIWGNYRLAVRPDRPADFEREPGVLVGQAFTYGPASVIDGEIELLNHDEGETCSSCEFTVGCSDATLLDADGDGLSDCEERSNAFSWSDPELFNGFSTALIERSESHTPSLESVATSEQVSALAAQGVRSRQFAGWGTRFESDTLPCRSDLLPGAPESCAEGAYSSGSYAVVLEGYIYPEYSGFHCFAPQAAGVHIAQVLVDGVSAASVEGVAGETVEALSCAALGYGPHKVQIVADLKHSDSPGWVKLRYCFNAGGECVPSEGALLQGVAVRPGVDGLGEEAGDTGFVPGSTAVACANNPAVCTELCPCYSSPCDDGNPCTVDICIPGEEYHLPVDTDDGDPCTNDSCDPVLGVIHEDPPTDSVCQQYVGCGEDGNPIFAGFSSLPLQTDDPCELRYCDEFGEEKIEARGASAHPCEVGRSCDVATGDLGAMTYEAAGTECGSGRACNAQGQCLPEGVTAEPFDPGDANLTLDELVASAAADSSCPDTFDPPEPEEMAVVSGIVLGRSLDGDLAVLQGATISVVGHCNWGSVVSRSDGVFRMPIQGGSRVVLRMSKEGYLPADRSVRAEVGGGDDVGFVVLLPLSQDVLSFDNSSAKMLQADPNGQGTPSLFVPKGLQINGEDDGEIRITPYTVGAEGPFQMPADLPPGTAYTHAFEATFNQTESATVSSKILGSNDGIAYYFDNFLEDCVDSEPPDLSPGEPEVPSRLLTAGTYDSENGPLGTGTGTCADYQVGKPVPNFFYNRQTGAWEREGDGTIVEIECNDDGTVIGLLGIDDLELMDGELGALNDQVQDEASSSDPARFCGQELMRAVLKHFSPHDLNWYRRQLGGLGLVDLSPPSGSLGNVTARCGSVIGVESKELGESIELPGTTQRLHYNSSAVFGYRDNYHIGGSLLRYNTNAPFNISHVFTIPGVGFHYAKSILYSPGYSNVASNDILYDDQLDSWRGVDEFGRRAYGVYRGHLQAWVGVPADAVRNWPHFELMGGFAVGLSVYDAKTAGFGGWTLSGHHTLQVNGEQRALYRGDRGRSPAATPQQVDMLLTADEITPQSYVHGNEFEVTGEGGFFFLSSLGSERSLYFVTPSGEATKAFSWEPAPEVQGTNVTTQRLAFDKRRDRLFFTDYYRKRLDMFSRSSPGAAWTRETLIEDLGGHPVGVVVRADGQLMVALESQSCDVCEAHACEDGPGTCEPLCENNGSCSSTRLFAVRENLGRFSREQEPVAYWFNQSGSLALATMEPVPDESDALVIGYPRVIDAVSSYRVVKWTADRGMEPLIWETSKTPGCGRDFEEGMPAAQFYAGTTHLDLLPLEGGRVLFVGDGRPGDLDGGVFEFAPADTATVIPERCSELQRGVDTPDSDERIDRRESIAIAGTIRRYAGNGCSQNKAPGKGDPQCLGGFGMMLGQDGLGRILLLQEQAANETARFTYPTLARISSRRPEGSTIEQLSADGSELFIFDKDGRHQKTVDPVDPNTVYRSFVYDSAGYLSEINEGGWVTKIDVKPSAKTAVIEGPGGQQTTISMDSAGYATEVHRNGGRAGADTITVAHDKNGLLKEMKDGDGAHRYEYRARGHLLADTLTASVSQESVHQELVSSWERHQSRISQVFTNGAGESDEHWYARGDDGQGARWVSRAQGDSYSLSTSGRRSVRTNDDGTVVTTAWAANPASGAFEPAQVTTEFNGRVVDSQVVVVASESGWTETTTVSGTGPTASTGTWTSGSDIPSTELYIQTRTPDENQIVTKTPSGVEVLAQYDDFGRIIQSRVGDLLGQSFSYQDGKLAGVLRETASDGDEQISTLAYVPSGQGAGYLKSVTTIEQAEPIVFTRDDYGRSLSSSQGTVSTHFDYDWAGRLSELVESGTQEHELQYTASGKLKRYQPPSFSDGDSPVSSDIRFVYDGAQRVSEVYYPVAEGGLREVVYRRDSVGNAHPGRLRRIEVLDSEAGDRTTEFVYGDEAFDVPLPGQEPMALGIASQVHEVVSASARTRFSWDGPLLASESQNQLASTMADTELRWKYDGLLRPHQRELLVNDESVGVTTASFDSDQRLRSLTDEGAEELLFGYDGDQSTDYTDVQVGRAGKPHGLLEQVRVDAIRESLEYDDYGRLYRQSVYASGELLHQVTINERDKLGRVVEQETLNGDNESTIENFSYDQYGQLKSGPGKVGSQVYEYDTRGNRTCVLLGMQEDCAEWKYATDSNGDNQLTSTGTHEYFYNAAGQLRAKKETGVGSVESFVYDVFGSLQSVRTETDGGSLISEVSYSTDYRGRRVRRTTSGGDFVQYVWGDALRIEATVDADGEVLQRFVYGLRPNVPELVVRYDEGGSSTYRVVTDQRGSPLHLIDVTDGTIWMSAKYDAWGNAHSLTIDGASAELSEWPIPFGFAGGLYDSATGLVRFGARDYDPSVGRWTAKDPILFNGGQTNLYVYVGNDPVSYTDPEGKWALQVAGAVLGGAAAAYANYGTLSGTDYAASIAFGAGAGLLATLPTSLIGGALAGGVGSGSTTLFSQGLTGHVEWLDVRDSALLGVGAGILGGIGAELGRNVLRSGRVIGDLITRTYVSGGAKAIGGFRNYGTAGGICGNTVGTGFATAVD